MYQFHRYDIIPTQVHHLLPIYNLRIEAMNYGYVYTTYEFKCMIGNNIFSSNDKHFPDYFK